MTDEATESKKPTGSMTTILVVLAGMLLLSLASLYMLNSRGPVEEAATARAAERMQARLDIAEEEKERLTTYGWADQAAQKGAHAARSGDEEHAAALCRPEASGQRGVGSLGPRAQ
jgi:hypothetical protein